MTKGGSKVIRLRKPHYALVPSVLVSGLVAVDQLEGACQRPLGEVGGR